MAATLEIFDSSIVAVGAFNPAIFSPDWLARRGLIGQTDCAGAKERKSLMNTHQVSIIETDWFVLQVLENQFSLTSKGPVTPSLRDLAVGILTLISQTPLIAIGLNFMGHYKFSNVAEYHKVGDTLAPKNIWEEVFSNSTLSHLGEGSQSIGLGNMTIKVQPCKRGEIPLTRDEKNITIQQSSKIRGDGILLSLNDHRDLTKWDDAISTVAEYAAQIIDRDWEGCNLEALRIFERTLSIALASSTV